MVGRISAVPSSIEERRVLCHQIWNEISVYASPMYQPNAIASLVEWNNQLSDTFLTHRHIGQPTKLIEWPNVDHLPKQELNNYVPKQIDVQLIIWHWLMTSREFCSF